MGSVASVSGGHRTAIEANDVSPISCQISDDDIEVQGLHAFILEKKVGQGAFGCVWRARRKHQGGDLVAIKVQDKDHIIQHGQVCRFRSEILLESLNRQLM